MSKEFNSEWLKNYDARNSRAGRNAINEELKDDSARKADNRPKEAKMDRGGAGTFAVSITLLYSSQRASDIDGGATTCLDCLIRALGRQSGVDSKTQRKLATRLKRAGRRGNCN